MSRYFIEFSYDGSNYHGAQKQRNSITIQEILETNISKYLGSIIKLTLAGRTDAGVHAKQMFAHFDFDQNLDQIFGQVCDPCFLDPIIQRTGLPGRRDTVYRPSGSKKYRKV